MIFNKKFLLFSFFHSADKFLMWIFPLFFLYFFNNNKLYAEIEIIISLVTILIFATELGIRNYVIYAFKNRHGINKN